MTDKKHETTKFKETPVATRYCQFCKKTKALDQTDMVFDPTSRVKGFMDACRKCIKSLDLVKIDS